MSKLKQYLSVEEKEKKITKGNDKRVDHYRSG